MKSGKQRRAEIIGKRIKRASKRAAMVRAAELKTNSSRFVPVNDTLLGPYNSYGVPDFVSRGYYIDLPFRCVDCGKEEIWTGSQQKWWYEVAKGFVYSTAIRCRSCRRRERKRRADARRVHLSGVAQRSRTSKR